MIGPKAYIHKERLKKNIEIIKSRIGSRNLMIVVKANGYGHGALIISKFLSFNKEMIFCVFSIEEAMELREGGVDNPILIFSRIQENWLDLAYQNNFWVNAAHLDDLILLRKIFESKGYCPSIHLKFDTGMTRLGFDLKERNDIFQFILDNPVLKIIGIYSHFSTADEGDLSYANYQLKLFNSLLTDAAKVGISFNYIHCSNSGSILNLNESLFNSVRVGMLVYGVAPSDEVKMTLDVKPVMSFCGPIVNIRKVEPNTQVSYGGVYTTSKSTNIGVIQTGFSDGIPRQWYENGYIGYNGAYFKIAGRICMDQFMVDFGNVEPQLGEEVLIFGNKNGNKIPIELIAKDINTTVYALLTAIQGRTEHIAI